MNSPEGREEPRRTAAIVKKTWWPGWIWAVPIAALAVCVWLLIREISSGTIDITVTFKDAAGIQAKNTEVVYRGLDVGRVNEVALAEDGSKVIAHLGMDASVKSDLDSGTHFYLRDTTPTFADLSTLKSIVSGPTIEMVPGVGHPTRQFVGIDGPPPPRLALAVPYLADFEGDAGDLTNGAPVTLRGFTVGTVQSVRLKSNPATGRIATAVVLALDPTRFNFVGAPPANGNWRRFLNAALSKLIAKGLRAEVTQSPAIIGARQIALDTVQDAPPARLSTAGPYPEIPTAAGGGFENVVEQVGRVPIAKIGDNVQAITAHVNKLVSAPQLEDAIDHLDRTLAGLDRVVQKVGPRIAPTVTSLNRTIDSLRRTAKQFDATAATIRTIAGGSAASPNGNLQRTLDELSRAGRAVRSLADYLDRHPEALIRGR